MRGADEEAALANQWQRILGAAAIPVQVRAWYREVHDLGGLGDRLPNMTSRRTSSDQRSPITSTAALIARPERD